MTTKTSDPVNLELQARRRWPDYSTVWRWHFYAGLICIPFVLWLAATGSIYLFKPQIDAWLDRPFDNVTLTASTVSPSAQVAAALAAVPGSMLHQYELPRTNRSAVQIVVGQGSDLKRAYVAPDSGKVLQVVDEDKRFTNMIFHLHGELMQGDKGSMVVETAASWTFVMLLTGLFLWWPRGSGAAGVLYPRLRLQGRGFLRDLHAVCGFWVSFFAMFLLISGLPWAKSWGGMLKEVRQWGATAVVQQDWTTGRSSELEQRRLASQQPPDEHAAHHHHNGAPSEAPPVPGYGALDRIVPTARDAGLAPPVLISPPSGANASWMAKSDSQNRPLRSDLTLDAQTGAIVSRRDFAGRPLLDRIVGIGVAAHEGQLFAPLNQLLGLFTAISLWIVCITAVVMWWRRRPTGVLGAPRPPARPRLAMGLFAVIILLAVAFPLLGATLCAVLLFEALVLRRWPAARDFLGLRDPLRT